MNPVHEKSAKKILEEVCSDSYLITSHEILPEIREFERTSPAKLILNKERPDESNLGVFVAGLRAKAGDHLTFYSNGGGGFGNPLERDPQLVLEDALDGYVSLQKARDIYGVVIRKMDEDTLQYEIDTTETIKLRASLAAKKERFSIGYGPGKIHPWGEKIMIAETTHISAGSA